MIDNKTIYEKKWKPETIQYMNKSFIARYQSFLIKEILTSYFDNTIYIYI